MLSRYEISIPVLSECANGIACDLLIFQHHSTSSKPICLAIIRDGSLVSVIRNRAVQRAFPQLIFATKHMKPASDLEDRAKSQVVILYEGKPVMSTG